MSRTQAASPCDGRIMSVVLSTCRLVAGGALLFAGVNKLMGPTTFMLSIEAFEILPVALVPFSAYAMIWTELIIGLLLVYGLLTRAGGLVALGLYIVFTIALASVILRGMPLDCGCFGGAFGGEVGWNSILRNSVFIGASALLVIFGGGRASLDAVFSLDAPLCHRRAASGSVAESAVSPSQEAS